MTLSRIKTAALVATTCFLTLAACDKPEDTAAKHFARATAFYEKGDFEKARIEYLNTARLLPSYAEVRYRLGLTEESLGNVREAFQNFMMAEQQDARHKGALTKLAQYFLIAENDAEMDKRVAALLQLSPDEPEAHALTAAKLLRQKKPDEAEKEALSALAVEPSNKTARAALAGVYRGKGQHAKAIEIVEDGLKISSDDVALLVLRATLYEEDKQPEKVEETYLRLIRSKPDIERFRLDLAKLYVEHGRPEDGEKTLADGISALPGSAALRHALIQHLATTKGIEAAEVEVERQNALRSGDKAASFWLADLYVQSGDLEKATILLEALASNTVDLSPSLLAQASLASLKMSQGEKTQANTLVEAILKKDPNNQAASFLKGAIAFEERRFDDAVALLRTVLRDEPKNAKALRLLGEALLRQGHKDLALDSFSRLVEADPTDIQAKIRLAQLFALQNNTKKAFDLLRWVIKADPKNPIAWESLARIAMQAKDWTIAGHAIKTLEQMEGQKALARFLRANLIAASDNPAEAIALYLPLIKENPDTPLADYALSAYLLAAKATGQEQKAVSALDDISFHSPTAHELLGDAYSDVGLTPKAIASYQEAIKAGTKRIEPFLALARFMIADKQTEKALAYTLQAEVASPNDTRPPLLRAEILTQAGQIDQAIQIYASLLDIDKGNDIAANNLAILLADFRSSDPQSLNKARQLAERFARAANPLLRDTLAWVLLKQGKIDEATPLFEGILASGVDLPAQADYHLGLWFLRKEQSPEAQKHLEKALSTNFSFSGRNDAETTLRDLAKKNQH